MIPNQPNDDLGFVPLPLISVNLSNALFFIGNFDTMRVLSFRLFKIRSERDNYPLNK